MAVAQISSKAGRGDTAVKAIRSHRDTAAAATRESAAAAKRQSRELELRQHAYRLALLFHRRWAPPLLAELLRGETGAGGARFITLANRLKRVNNGREISRESLKATLDFLIRHDYVMRNPGYGHAMRPEYLLAEAGYQIAPHCQALLTKLQTMRMPLLAQRKWTLPAVFAIGQGIGRFGELKAILPRITARALTLTLKQLIEAGAIDREIVNRYPPSTNYRLMASMRSLLPILARF